MNMIVGENLKELRKKKNTTQEDLAEFFMKTLNDFGAMGWEAVNYNDDDMANNPRVFFKRPL